MTNAKIKRMTTQQKQVFAAKCFSKYCEEKGITHKFIDELIEHLISIENFENIVDWERKGGQLQLTGRGDELPKSLNSIVSLKDRSTFIELIDTVVEVGIVDMYGEETEKPRLFLVKCIDILKKNKVSIPKF